ncbi:MAG TPA: hypothetical protein VIZ86_16735 [Pseudomonas sp.]
MKTPTDQVAVRYIGTKPDWLDRLYGSGLIFAIDQARTVPAALAKRLLRHEDLFARVEAAEAAALPVEHKAEPIDDTAELLEQSDKARAEQDKREFDLADLHREIDSMDFGTLRDFAEQRYGLKLTQQKGLEKGRAELHARIDQFGAV